MLSKLRSGLAVLLLLLCDIMYGDVKLLRRLKSVQLSTVFVSKLENQSGIKLLKKIFMAQSETFPPINVLLRDKIIQHVFYQPVKCAEQAQAAHRQWRPAPRCSQYPLSLCQLQKLSLCNVTRALLAAVSLHERGMSGFSSRGGHPQFRAGGRKGVFNRTELSPFPCLGSQSPQRDG